MQQDTVWRRARNYDFIIVPKDLFRMPQYLGISPLAKLLYGFLMDRTSLSEANGAAWTNEQGECFVIFTVAEIMERFGCGHDKAAALLRELETAGLITRTRKSRNKSPQIVVKPFVVSGKNQTSGNRKNQPANLRNSEPNKTENKTELNHTDPITPFDRGAVAEKIKENICYEVLLETIPEDLLRGIVDVIVETICSPSATVMISGELIPREEVRRRFWALEQMQILYVHDCLKNEGKLIRNMRGFLLARLYNARDYMDSYYEAWVRRDMGRTTA